MVINQDNFIPASNHILLELVESKEKFKVQKKSEGLTSESKIGKVLAVGEAQSNDFGVVRDAPCQVGDTVLFVSEINQNYLEVDFKQYPVVRYGHILGVIKEENGL